MPVSPILDLVKQLVQADLSAPAFRDCCNREAGGQAESGLLQEFARPFQGSEQALDSLAERGIGFNSHFLLRNSFEQVREVFTLITAKLDLNLYGR